MSEQLEITVSWDSNPLHSTLHTEGAIAIGPSGESWFSLPESVLASNHELIIPQGENAWILSIPEGAKANVAKDGNVIELDGTLVPLTAGVTAEVRLGAFSFFVRPTAKVESTMPKTNRRYRWMRWLAVAAALHLIVLGMFAMSPPNVAALNGSDLAAAARYIPVQLDPAATDTPVVELPSTGDAGSNSDSAGAVGGGESTSAASEASSAAPRRDHGRHNPAPAFIPTAQNVNQLGAIAAINNMMPSFGDDASPYTAGSAQEGPGGLSNASLLSLPGGTNWGALDMNNAGHGTCDPSVQDCTQGMLGNGPLDTHGDTGTGRIPDLGPRREPRGPEIHTQPARTIGSLSRDQVRVTVRRHINEVRFCYEQGLQQRPDLEGRVAVSFIIAPTGVVQSSTVASSTVHDARVSGCVSQAVARWTFPSAAGVTGVTYPFVLQSH